jgi:transmembrane 9 superfamily protein 2/4
MLLIIILWFGISAPLSAIGAYYGSKHGVSVRFTLPATPVDVPYKGYDAPREGQPDPKTNPAHSQVFAALGSGPVKWHPSVWRVLPHLACLFVLLIMSIMLPGAAFVELYFVLSSLFASRAYYAFGFLALTAGVVALTTATVTILFTYFMLCAEEYRSDLLSLCISVAAVLTCTGILARWHWRAFLAGGGSAFWLLAYGLYYWASRLSLGSMSSVLLYLGYLVLLALLDFLVTGTPVLSWSLFRARNVETGESRHDWIPCILLGCS